MSRRGENFVAAAQHVLPHDLCRHIRVTGLGQVAVCRAADETAFALRIEPACRLSIWNDWCERRARILFAARSALLSTALSTLAALATLSAAALSAASALVASATSVVTVIAIAILVAALIALLLSLTAAAAFSASPAPSLTTAHRLRIVLGLLL
jgi:hypothetical protein